MQHATGTQSRQLRAALSWLPHRCQQGYRAVHPVQDTHAHATFKVQLMALWNKVSNAVLPTNTHGSL